MAPSPDAVLFAQDKRFARESLARLGFPSPPFAVVDSIEEVDSFAGRHGWPVVAKAPRGGYGGGVFIFDDRAAAHQPDREGPRQPDPGAAARDPP